MGMLTYAVVLLVYASSLAFSIWFFGIRSGGRVSDRLGLFLQVVAVYTTILGLFSGAGALDSLPELGRDLTSGDPLRFLRGNLVAFAGLFAVLAVAFDPSTSASATRFLVTVPVLLALAFLVVVYAVLHLLIVVPIAYLGYVITGIPIDAILRAQGGDMAVTFGDSEIQIKTLVQQHELAVRNFAVGLPAFVLSLVLKMAPLVRPARRRTPDLAAR